MNLTWAQNWLDLFNDVDEMMKLYQPDVKFDDPTWGVSFDSVEGVRTFFSGFSAPDAGHHTFKAHRWVGNEDGGALDWIWSADFEGDFLGYPAAGRHLELPGMTIFSFRDGKISYQQDVWDSGRAYREFGITKPLG